MDYNDHQYFGTLKYNSRYLTSVKYLNNLHNSARLCKPPLWEKTLPLYSYVLSNSNINKVYVCMCVRLYLHSPFTLFHSLLIIWGTLTEKTLKDMEKLHRRRLKSGGIGRSETSHFPELPIPHPLWYFFCKTLCNVVIFFSISPGSQTPLF